MKKLILSTLLSVATLSTTLHAIEVSLEQRISGLYVAYFDRGADLEGLDSWKNKGEDALSRGENVEEILNQLSLDFSRHHVFISTYSMLDNQAFVEAIYRNALGNRGDAEGVDFWTTELDKGLSRSEMVSSFISISLTADIDNRNFPTLSTTELELAQLRQELISNQVEVALAFTHTLGTQTNVSNLNAVEEDPAYRASIKILEGVTTDRVTVTDKINYLENLADNPNAITEILGEKEDSSNSSNQLLAQDEPYYGYLWHIDSANSKLTDEGYPLDKNADINITQAWKLTMGEGIKVAVIDDGAEVNHEDLKENIFVAYNADNKNSDINTYSDNPSHGNSCAGLIVSPINGKGVVGVAPKSKLIAIRQEEESEANAIEAFEYAKKQGAKVISCSWGTEAVSEILIAELKSLYDSGITVLFASGNDGKNLDVEGIDDESEVQWVIGVGGTSELNDVTSYSNYGQHIDILSPGGDTWEASGILGLDDMGSQGGDNQLGLVNNNYAFIDGTSFSTPITAGVVVLMYAVNPTITPAQVRDILISTATKIGLDNGASYNNGFDTKRAYGKINAGRAVEEAKRLSQ